MSDSKLATAVPNRGQNAVKHRSLRVSIAIPIIVRGEVGGRDFEESTTTVTVSKHGCMMMLEAKIGRAEMIKITNIATGQEVQCAVSYTGARDQGHAEVAAEFLKSVDFFWRIVFPPDYGEPSERKAIVAPKMPAPLHK